MKLTANARRSGGWWAIEVPEIDGLFTQARRLTEVPDMVRDAAALLTNRPAEDFDVEVVPHVPTGKSVPVVRGRMQQLHEIQAEVQAEAHKVAYGLHQDGLTYREIGTVLGVSHQRAHQLVKN